MCVSVKSLNLVTGTAYQAITAANGCQEWVQPQPVGGGLKRCQLWIRLERRALRLPQPIGGSSNRRQATFAPFDGFAFLLGTLP